MHRDDRHLPDAPPSDESLSVDESALTLLPSSLETSQITQGAASTSPPQPNPADASPESNTPNHRSLPTNASAHLEGQQTDAMPQALSSASSSLSTLLQPRAVESRTASRVLGDLSLSGRKIYGCFLL